MESENAEITSTEPVEEAPASAPEPQESKASQPVVDEAALEERITQRLVTELDGRLGARVEDAMGRLKQSQRDSIEQRFRKVKQDQARVIEETIDSLVKVGDLTQEQADARKMHQLLQLDRKIDQEALQEAEKAQPEQPDVMKKWKADCEDAMDEYELRAGDPEYAKFVVLQFSGDPETARREMRKQARKLGRDKEARLAAAATEASKQQKEQQRMSEDKKKAAQAKAVNVDTGASTGTAPRTRATVEAELEQYQKMPPGMAREEREARRKKAFELAEELDRLPAG